MKRLLLIAFFLCAGSTNLQSRIFVNIDSPSGQSLPIAISPLRSLDNHDVAFFQQFNALLERDLRMTGLFRILSQRSFLEGSEAGIKAEDTNFSLWRKSGADALVKGGYKRNGDSYTLEIRLFDVQLQQVIIGKRYHFNNENFANVVHTFADQIILKLTGDNGVFASTRLACVTTVGGRKEVIEMGIDGSNLRQITRHRSVSLSPTWSRDGRMLAYTSYFQKNPNLYLFDRLRNEEKRISARPGLNLGATFAPKHDLIALAVSNNSDPEIVLINYKGQLVKALTDNWWIDIEPSWSPEGKEIIYVSNASGQPHIYRMDVDGKNVKRLTYQGYHNVSPNWSPKGDKIVFAGRDEGFFDIFIMNPDGSHIQRLTKGSGNNESPKFSPNGQMIAFSSSRSGKEQIYVMGLDGRGQTQITDGIGRYTQPSWSSYLNP